MQTASAKGRTIGARGRSSAEAQNLIGDFPRVPLSAYLGAHDPAAPDDLAILGAHLRRKLKRDQ